MKELFSQFGYRALRFDPSEDSSMRFFQLVLNTLLNILFGFMTNLPLYLGLAGYYFYGAIGKNRLAKTLFGLLIVVAILDVFFECMFGLIYLLSDLDVMSFESGSISNDFCFWFRSITTPFYSLMPFFAVAFGVVALVARKVSVSMQLIPIFAGVLFSVFYYPLAVTSLNANTIPDFITIFIYLGLVAFYLRGAIGENIWAKILFGGLLTLIAFNIAFEVILIAFSFINMFGIATEIRSSIIFEWFMVLGKIKYVFLPIISIAFGITSLFVKRRNIFLQITPIFAGIFYAIYYFLPYITYFVSSDTFSNLLGMTGSFGMRELIWCLIGVAVLRSSKLVSPFLISILALNSLQLLVLIFLTKIRSEQLYVVLLYTFFVSAIVQMIFIFYMWSAIDDGKNKIKPWLAVGLGIVPIVSFFWNLYLYGKFPQSFNDYIDRNKIETHYISTSPFIVYIILSVLVTVGLWIPYLGVLLGLAFFIAYIVLIIKTCNAITRLNKSSEFNESSSLVLDI